VSSPTNTHQEKSRVAADTEVLPDDPETRVLYLRHWNTIRTEEATSNRVQDRYNFTLHEMTASTFTEMVHRIFREQYLQQQDMTPADFKGVTLDDLVILEQLFSLNVYVYDLQET
jgi:tripartite-type tricarboxylate transporter receptor subunit TctC